jgi:hypothetical protein
MRRWRRERHRLDGELDELRAAVGRLTGEHQTQVKRLDAELRRVWLAVLLAIFASATVLLLAALSLLQGAHHGIPTALLILPCVVTLGVLVLLSLVSRRPLVGPPEPFTARNLAVSLGLTLALSLGLTLTLTAGLTLGLRLGLPKSPPGVQGGLGKEGVRGEEGMKGKRGLRGQRGDLGTQGERGQPGARGPRGPQGVRGERGPPGRGYRETVTHGDG